MEKAFVISDEQARSFLSQRHLLDFDANALLRIWLFHNCPEKELCIIIDSTRQYGLLPEFQDRLGLVGRHHREGWIHFSGDNRIVYEGYCTDGTHYKLTASPHHDELIEELHRKALDIINSPS